ncbi:serine carboxypeptidase S28-domain-containing protein [Papiliotrema laurentii]|uniref:Serine carboxypeptidase S28-domain-containing protein n=1 Tax=Papiliotrema laurentii TaxID=5418 RepID=A0AAD9FMY6_PAPLA|nr:serine carboxypeptidase S28-domain-containing protein [Papiliotrema laurentii]
MRLSTLVLASASLLAAGAVELDPSTHHRLLLSGRPQVGLWKALLKEAEQSAQLAEQSHVVEQAQLTFTARPSKYKPYCFDQPLSHFDPAHNSTFCQRYWIDGSAYKPGGPIFLLDGGETSGANRIPFLETGILDILSNATNGIGIVLEHRYYGHSVPVPNLSTDNLRFLNNEEALEDSANFIRNFYPPAEVLKLDDPSSLHPKKTPWIYYGGSYAGARAAHMRVEYPDLVWGAIASSAVTHAQVNFPEYHDPIQQYGPEDCISALQSAVKTIDTLLDLPHPVPSVLKGMFGLEHLKDDADFAEVISSPLGYWQAQNWDPAVGSTGFQVFCDALTAGGAGSKVGLIRIPAEVVNYGKYIKGHVVSQCPESGKGPAEDIEDCFGSSDDEKFRDTDLSQTWRLWLFQVCTQWGYFMPAPLEGPSIVSSRLTLEHTAKICKQAFPAGKHFTVPPVPDVESVNARGDYAIEADRLAFIDGDRDPWRVMTPQSDLAPKRTSSVNKPVHLIFNAIHHYDENGLKRHSDEPARIRDVHELEKNFVQEWVAQFHEQKRSGQ